MGVEGKSLFSWLKKQKAKKVFCFDDNNIGKPLTEKQKEIFEVTFGERQQTELQDRKGNIIIYEKGNREYGAHHIKKKWGYNAVGEIAFEEILLLSDILEKGVINEKKTIIDKEKISCVYEYRIINKILSVVVDQKKTKKKTKKRIIISFHSHFIFHKKIEEGLLSDQPNSLPLYCLPLMQKVFRSPGVHPQKILKYIGKGKQSHNTEISSSTQLFFDISPTQKIIGVTGTKGKGTTSSLIYKICKKNIKENNLKNKVFLGGNIGTPIFDFFDEIKKDDIVILELSSFQLYDLKKSPSLAVLLRTDSEHLDWHRDINDYRNAKKNIFLHQKTSDNLIYFDGDKITKSLVLDAKSKKVSVFSQKEKKWIDIMENKIDNQKIISSNIKGMIADNEQISISDIALRGDFHQENILAALATAQTLNIPNRISKKVISTFIGLPMRCELVAEKNGIFFFNDSFSTIPETTISALSTFSSPVFLILGGSEKYSDFTELSEYIKNNEYIQKIYLIGVTAERIRDSLEEVNGNTPREMKIEIKDNFQDIFSDFKKISQKGDSLLLSPGCASFGMFDNYKIRGEVFNKLAL